MAIFYSKMKIPLRGFFLLSFLLFSNGAWAVPAAVPTNGKEGSLHLPDDRARSPLRGMETIIGSRYPEKDVSGLITDTTGSPLPGVTVVVKGNPSVGTTSDLNGRYILRVPDNAVLQFKMLGFDEQDIPVKGRREINVKLAVSTNSLNETVVVAYGEQKKEDVIGSITTISPEKLKVPSSNLTTALAGRLPGVIAFQRSGEPGADNASFFIRGITTFGTNTNPLILIDGIELTATDLARLQPDDIASFSIMKDATATALYGARGANGVILVTTKEGKEGKAVINLRIENSVSMPTRNVKVADPVTYMEMANEASFGRNPELATPYQQEKIDNTIAGTNPYAYPAVDWRKDLFNNYALTQRANLSISGGGKVARYYVAGSFDKDNGVLKVDHRNNFNNNIDLKSYTLRSNVNIDISKSTELTVRLDGQFDDYTGPIDGGTTMYQKVMSTSPVDFPPYFPADSAHSFVKHILFGNYDDGSYDNPYADMVDGYKNYSRSLMLAQVELKQNLDFWAKGLSFRAMINTTRKSYFDVTRSYKPFFYASGPYNKVTGTFDLVELNPTGGTEYLGYNEGDKELSSTFYGQGSISYDQTYNKKHHVSGLLVATAQQSLSANAGSLQLSLPSRNLGFAGRMTYSYDERYFGEFNFGYNGSERFAANHRFGFFPSGGLAWSVSNEHFWEPLKNAINQLRITATYGLVGNDQIGSPSDRFFYLSEVNMNDAGKAASFGTDNGERQNGVTVSRYADPDITWEVAYKSNLRLELGLFNRLNMVAEFYTEKRTNILQTRAAFNDAIGLSADVKANVGEASGRGIDLSMNYAGRLGRHFYITSMGNFTYAASKYLVYEEPEYTDAPYLSHVGHSLSQIWGYVAERLFVDDAEVQNSPTQNFGGTPPLAGDIKYRDINGDGTINTLDKVPIGYPQTPEITYGFGVSINNQKFDMSVFFQGTARESFWLGVSQTAPFVDNHQLLQVYADNHWSEDNRDLYALWPRLTYGRNDNNTQTTTWYMRNGAFLRLKTAELGYTLPASMSGKVGMKTARIYVNGTNLWCLSAFKLWDVEMAGDGLGYPIQKVFNLGVNVTF